MLGRAVGPAPGGTEVAGAGGSPAGGVLGAAEGVAGADVRGTARSCASGPWDGVTDGAGSDGDGLGADGDGEAGGGASGTAGRAGGPVLVHWTGSASRAAAAAQVTAAP
ncbi:hypothetical protein ABT333_41380, partial [Streptomyces flaveolus]